MSDFVPGWFPELYPQGRANFDAAGGKLFEGVKYQIDTRPMPPGFSLSSFVKWCYDQGQVGSCFANARAHSVQIKQQILVANGYEGKAFNPSRRLIWYGARKLDGSLGSRSDGATILNSFAAVSNAPRGLGICNEEEWPYQANHSWLETTPPASVLQDADKTRQADIAELDYNVDAWKRSIFNGDSVGIGIYWPSGWDSNCDSQGMTTGVGRGGYGHAVEVIGWIDSFQGSRWWEIQNSHGKIYGSLGADLAKQVTGYKFSGYSFWAREDHLQSVLDKGQGYEAFHGGVLSGFTQVDVIGALKRTFKLPLPRY